jgi:hypothetical protein
MMTGPIPSRGISPLPQHFLLSPAARTLSLRDIIRMADDDAHARFVAIRCAANSGEGFVTLLSIGQEGARAASGSGRSGCSLPMRHCFGSEL